MSYNIIPNVLVLKAPYHNFRLVKIILRASVALLQERIKFHRYRIASQFKQIEKLESYFLASLLQSDYQRIFTAVNSSYRHVYYKTRNIRIQKFLAFQNVNHKTTTPLASTNQKFVLNRSDHIFTKAEEMGLQKELNCGVAVKLLNLDMT
jgi:hypothetical protein